MDAAVEPPPSSDLFTRIRLATKSDVSHIHKLIHQMAINHRMTHLLSATPENLSSTLFNSVPFESPTVFLLEVSSRAQSINSPHAPHFSPILKTLTLPSPISDPDEADFSCGDGGVVVAGFVLFLPKYVSIVAKQGFYIENVFVRECYRRNGMGRMLMSAVAAQAAALGMERVEWAVMTWNVDAIRFYEAMGAQVMQDVKICRLTGEALRSYGCGAAGGRISM